MKPDVAAEISELMTLHAMQGTNECAYPRNVRLPGAASALKAQVSTEQKAVKIQPPFKDTLGLASKSKGSGIQRIESSSMDFGILA